MAETKELWWIVFASVDFENETGLPFPIGMRPLPGMRCLIPVFDSREAALEWAEGNEALVKCAEVTRRLETGAGD